MKPKLLSEVREVVNSERFRSWFDSLQKARLAAREAVLRYEEILTQVHLMEFKAELAQKKATDTLYRASSYEDSAALLQADAQDLENKSLDLVATFEEQRKRTTDKWVSVSAIEKEAEERKAEGKPLDAVFEVRLRSARDEYERETVKKNRLWEDVESMWAAGLEKNLAVVENRSKAERVRRESEALFGAADQSSRFAQSLKAESEDAARAQEKAEQAVQEMMTRARSQFDAIVHEEFLYWLQRENNKMVYLTPLFSDSSNFNLELKACAIYQCGRTRGVEFLEPVVSVVKPDGTDTRLDDFFLKGRPVAAASGAAPEPAAAAAQQAPKGEP